MENFKHRQETLNVAPKLPAVRPRAISLPRPPGDVSTEEACTAGIARMNNEVQVTQTTYDQTECSILFTLPLEIRTMIWEYAITGYHIHIARRRGRLGHAVCPHPDVVAERGPYADLCLERKDGNGMWLPTKYHSRMKLLSLSMACRQIYSETIDLLYSGNTFAFADPLALEWLHSSVLPSRIQRLRSVEVSWQYQRKSNYGGLYGEKSRSRMILKLSKNGQPPLRNLRFVFSTGWPPYRVPASEYDQPKVNEILPWGMKLQNPIQVVLPWHSLDCPTTDVEEGNCFYTVRRLPRDNHGVAAFAVPFNVRCLHCADGTLIPAGIRTTAEKCFFDTEGVDEEGFFEGPEMYRIRHGKCGGMIEFETEPLSESWQVNHGAERVE